MKGILVISHGNTAPGLLDSLSMFFSKDVPLIDCLSLKLEDAVEDFRDSLRAKIDALDDGEGVIVLADLFGGTPANEVIKMKDDRIQIIAGVNLPLLIEVVQHRMQGDLNLEAIVTQAKDCIVLYKERNFTESGENFFD